MKVEAFQHMHKQNQVSTTALTNKVLFLKQAREGSRGPQIQCPDRHGAALVWNPEEPSTAAQRTLSLWRGPWDVHRIVGNRERAIEAEIAGKHVQNVPQGRETWKPWGEKWAVTQDGLRASP